MDQIINADRNIPNISLINNYTSPPLSYASSNTTNEYFTQLLHQREHIPCNISSTYKINNRNYAPFSLRCQITNNWLGPRKGGRLEGGRFSSDIGYIAVWKAGLTSTIQILDRYINFNWTDSPPKHISRDTYFSENIHNMFLFTFVRDPIQRFMSAYFEVHKRINLANTERHMMTLRHLDNDTLTPLENVRVWINAMHNQITLYNDAKFTKKKKGMHSRPPIYKDLSVFGDVHFYPQITFLRWKQWAAFPLDYIGDLNSDFFDMLYDVIQYYGNYRNVSQQQLSTIRARNKNSTVYSSGFEKYAIDEKLLTDMDIKMLCEVYWLDYICLPLQVPSVCNLTFLFEQHYGKHVVYKDCDQITYEIKNYMD